MKWIMTLLFLLSDGSYVGPFEGSILFSEQDTCERAKGSPDTIAAVRDATGYLNQLLHADRSAHPEEKDLTIVDVKLDCTKQLIASE